tara:strand:+ start:76 stop:978 length:903 start_codon:yes stop_codon:yes gene_type:complete
MNNKFGHNTIRDPKITIEKNIERKKPILDREPQLFLGVPLPSWIELSLIDVCNRDCSFCPKSDANIAPNTYMKMEIKLIEKMISDLKRIKFEGSFTMCGYGEPLLHPNISEITNLIGQFWGIEIVTNGDPLTKKKLIELYNSKVSKLVVSMYDGPEQIDKFTDMLNETNIPKDFMVLRDRWHKGEEFSDYITNRAGTVTNGKQIEVKEMKDKKCFYPAYHVQIDWNGDIYICPHDWQRRNPVGNIMQTDFFEIWNGKIHNKYRKMLFKGKRDELPCSTCNCVGTVHGSKHYIKWLQSWIK